MKIKNILKLVMLSGIIVLGSITFFSCSNEKAKLKVICVSPDTTSFSKDILPILNASCNTAGCHNATSNAGHLNLSATTAYSELLHPGSGYVDTLHPQASILYNKLTTASSIMPPSGRLDDCKIKLVLQWINEKAKNN